MLNYSTIVDKENIRILKKIFIKNQRIDEICFNLYDEIEFSIKKVLEFNNIQSIESIDENIILFFPDLHDLEKHTIDVDDENIAGINNIDIVGLRKTYKILKYNEDKTIGTEKLGIVLDKIKYDKETSIISY